MEGYDNRESKYPARLEICESCGLHGWIRFRNRNCTIECWSKAEFVSALRDARQHNMVTDGEVTDLIQEINGSTIPGEMVFVKVPPDFSWMSTAASN
ncbi:MAG TPA: hypothetical protein PLF31_00420 [Candidatus Paceibacterota bacterium]|nr:hypothetical protein [Candidatus Paceibacterota bacterium]